VAKESIDDIIAAVKAQKAFVASGEPDPTLSGDSPSPEKAPEPLTQKIVDEVLSELNDFGTMAATIAATFENKLEDEVAAIEEYISPATLREQAAGRAALNKPR
jgi:hypothetical protein